MKKLALISLCLLTLSGAASAEPCQDAVADYRAFTTAGTAEGAVLEGYKASMAKTLLQIVERECGRTAASSSLITEQEIILESRRQEREAPPVDYGGQTVCIPYDWVVICN